MSHPCKMQGTLSFVEETDFYQPHTTAWKVKSLVLFCKNWHENETTQIFVYHSSLYPWEFGNDTCIGDIVCVGRINGRFWMKVNE